MLLNDIDNLNDITFGTFVPNVIIDMETIVRQTNNFTNNYPNNYPNNHPPNQ